MAKILVADDNSNVQKTVALALADLGVQVIAVNNGDAAVRKLGDIMPDLVLADIFMPVRNGYEVCDFVKKDSRFSHVPVVLLVGAFDPLDEREAQRVAADGILKKPFVPPDPLIAMVKTLLDRSLNERLVAVGAETKPAAGSVSAAKVVERPAPPPQAAEPVIPELSPEPAPEEFQPPTDRMSFGEGEAPVAFGQLLDPPVKEAEPEAEAVEPVEDDQIFTSARDANLGEPVFWKAEEPEAETEEGEAQAEEEDSADFSSSSWGLGEASLDAHSSTEETETAETAEQVEPLELVRDDDSDTQAPSTIVEPSALFADAASQASLHVQAGKADDLAANPLDWMASAPPQPVEEAPAEEEAEAPWNAAETEFADESTEASEQPAEEEPVQEMELAPEPFEPPPPPLPAPPPSASPIATSPASFLGTAMPPAKPPMPPPAPSASAQTKSTAPASDPNKTIPPFKPLEQSADDTARSIPMQQWADLASGMEAPRTVTPPAGKTKPTATTPAAPVSKAAPANAAPEPPSEAPVDDNSPDPALVEAVVQRVLDKMRPQVVDIITKEFLRPVVQALVHREINREPTKH